MNLITSVLFPCFLVSFSNHLFRLSFAIFGLFSNPLTFFFFRILEFSLTSWFLFCNSYFLFLIPISVLFFCFGGDFLPFFCSVLLFVFCFIFVFGFFINFLLSFSNFYFCFVFWFFFLGFVFVFFLFCFLGGGGNFLLSFSIFFFCFAILYFFLQFFFLCPFCLFFFFFLFLLAPFYNSFLGLAEEYLQRQDHASF